MRRPYGCPVLPAQGPRRDDGSVPISPWDGTADGNIIYTRFFVLKKHKPNYTEIAGPSLRIFRDFYAVRKAFYVTLNEKTTLIEKCMASASVPRCMPKNARGRMVTWLGSCISVFATNKFPMIVLSASV